MERCIKYTYLKAYQEQKSSGARMPPLLHQIRFICLTTTLWFTEQLYFHHTHSYTEILRL